MKIFSICVLLLMAFSACQESDDDGCVSAIVLGEETHCQLLNSDSHELVLLALESEDTLMALFPGETLTETGTTVNVQFKSMAKDSLVCLAIVSWPLVEITDPDCN